jgi:hypothetical protein
MAHPSIPLATLVFLELAGAQIDFSGPVLETPQELSTFWAAGDLARDEDDHLPVAAEIKATVFAPHDTSPPA